MHSRVFTHAAPLIPRGIVVLPKSGAQAHAHPICGFHSCRNPLTTKKNMNTSLFASVSTQPALACLVLLLVTASVIDFRTLRIPNWLSVGGIVAGLAFGALLAPGSLDRIHGFSWALQGLALCFAITIPFYIMGLLGAGDVKLTAMTGAFLGPWDALHVVLFAFIAGGIAVLAISASQFAALATGRPQFAAASARATRLPFAASVAVGTLAWLVARQLGWA
jgi:prepilin peptidase CpaA